MTALSSSLLAGLLALAAGCASLADYESRYLTPEQAVQMAKAGASAEAIIQRMKETHSVYRLSASELVKLHEQGLPAAVLDYMQSTYLDDVRRDEAFRAWSYRPFGWYGPYSRHYWYHPYWW